MKRLLLLATLVALAFPAPAKAQIVIVNDNGGRIERYLNHYNLLRDSNKRVMILGDCISSCTLLLAVVPRERICAGSRARLGFHAPYNFDKFGQVITSRFWTQAMWELYPDDVRKVVTKRGGLSRKMIFLQGRVLYALIPHCTPQPDVEVRPALVQPPERAMVHAQKR